MRKAERAAQARRELDRKFKAAHLEPIVASPRAGWIRAVRGALGMSQAALAARLDISAPAVAKLEKAERMGGITLSKMAQVATALNCSFVYALVPITTIEDTIQAEAQRSAALAYGYASRTMALEAQAVAQDREQDAVTRLAQDLINRGDLWRGTPAPRQTAAT